MSPVPPLQTERMTKGYYVDGHKFVSLEASGAKQTVANPFLPVSGHNAMLIGRLQEESILGIKAPAAAKFWSAEQIKTYFDTLGEVMPAQSDIPAATHAVGNQEGANKPAAGFDESIDEDPFETFGEVESSELAWDADPFAACDTHKTDSAAAVLQAMLRGAEVRQFIDRVCPTLVPIATDYQSGADSDFSENDAFDWTPRLVVRAQSTC